MTRQELQQEVKETTFGGLELHTYSPRDGITRYRFSNGNSYFADDGIYTALGLKEAITYFKGYADGMLYK